MTCYRVVGLRVIRLGRFRVLFFFPVQGLQGCMRFRDQG